MTDISRITASWLEEEDIKLLAALFDKVGVAFYFVGGCVRDAFIGRPAGDIDACTSLLPEAVIDLLTRANIRTLPTGLTHGTVTALLGGRSIEITTLRKDTACDGRHAVVEFTDSLAEDAARRDFTMNALYCDIHGQITDFYDGINDAEKGIIRFIGNPEDRIREDALRILRYFRFLATHGKTPPDEVTLIICQRLSPMIENLSGERIQTEMLKLLAAKNPLPSLEGMQGEILAQIIPYNPRCERLEDVLLAEASLAFHAAPLTRLAALLRSTEFPAEAATNVANRWRLSVADAKLLLLLSTHELLPSDASESLMKIRLRSLGKETFMQLALLSWQVHTAEVCEEALKLAQNWMIPTFPVGGEDLIALGWQEGKALGEKLKMLEAVWESQDYRPSKEALVAMAGTP